MEGNIVDQREDAIVSSANCALKHEDGVAKAIADAAGQKLISSSLQYLKHNGVVSEGQAIYTEPGLLANNGIKHVIHAVGPQSYRGEQDVKKILNMCVNHILNLA